MVGKKTKLPNDEVLAQRIDGRAVEIDVDWVGKHHGGVPTLGRRSDGLKSAGGFFARDLRDTIWNKLSGWALDS
jgi:hypothetical protein